MISSSQKLLTEQQFSSFVSEIGTGLSKEGIITLDRPDFLFWKNLATLCENKIKDQALHPAKIGSSGQQSENKSIRGDFIYWLDQEPNSNLTKESSDCLLLQDINQFLQALSLALGQDLFLPIQTYEAHLAYYPSGSSYKRHWDQPKNSQDRIITFILYLNENWSPPDGGKLSVYKNEDDELPFLRIEPKAGRWVFFRSEKFPHEVELANSSRKSLTGWFKNKKKYL